MKTTRKVNLTVPSLIRKITKKEKEKPLKKNKKNKVLPRGA